MLWKEAIWWIRCVRWVRNLVFIARECLLARHYTSKKGLMSSNPGIMSHTPSSLKSPDLTVYASDACWWLMASAATSPAMELRNASCAKASRMVNMPAAASQRVAAVAVGKRHRLRVARGVLGIRHIDVGFAKNSAVCSECPCRGAFAQLLLPRHERHVSGMRSLGADRTPCRNCCWVMRRRLRNGIAVLGLIGPRTQAACSQRTIRGSTAQSSRRYCIRHTLF